MDVSDTVDVEKYVCSELSMSLARKEPEENEGKNKKIKKTFDEWEEVLDARTSENCLSDLPMWLVTLSFGYAALAPNASLLSCIDRFQRYRRAGL